jgi:predicted NUDIX family phosphoesterase
MEILEEFAGEIIHIEDLRRTEHPYCYDHYMHRPSDVILAMEDGMMQFFILFDDQFMRGNVEKWTFTDPYCLIRSEKKKIIVERKADLGEDALLNRWDYENHVRKMAALKDAETILEVLLGGRKE